MNKKIIGILLAAMFLMSLALPVCAEETAEEAPATVTVSIRNVDDFLDFAENCRLDSYSLNMEVQLEADLDLAGVAFEGIPIFSGRFLGKGHTISGVDLKQDGSVIGLFRYLTVTAVVEDLHVQGNIHPEGSRGEVGALAGQNAGMIKNCSFSGAVSGGDYVGGLVGRNSVTGLLENCKAEGDIHGNHFVGGVAGDNCGVIRNCKNFAAVNTTPQQNTVGISDITLDTMANSESMNTVTDIGGISGISVGVIRGCENYGDIGYRHMGYNIGGIAGTQSGYLVDCENQGNIRGRKEVGGIVGQMEPVTRIEYSEDTLQILQGQLDTMSGVVGQVSYNAQTNAGEITGNIALLQDQTETAREAVAVLIPTPENPELPDADAIAAAQNTLSATLNAMPATVSGIASAAENTVNGLSRDLQAVSGQISAMSRTIQEASEEIGGSITDVSDLDTDEMLTGKIADCRNLGSVLADLNVGGIAGAMAMENDMDILSDWEQSGEDSLNFQSEIRAVIVNCQNLAEVTGSKQNVGGIVGWQSLGLVKNSGNTGVIDGSAGDYAGGVAGLSTGYIRSCYAKCEISGNRHVGGIAGCATVVTDSLAQVMLEGKENMGAILGGREEPLSEVEDPVSGNYYLVLEKDLGAVDGISYAGVAEPLPRDAFLDLEHLPELFKSVQLRFVYENGNDITLTAALGGAVDGAMIPAVPQKTGHVAAWEGLEDADLGEVLFDRTFRAVYTPYISTVQSEETRENGRPLVLLEGGFDQNDKVTLEQMDSPQLAEGTALEAWKISMDGQVSAIRFLLPDSVEGESVLLYVRDSDGTWKQTDSSVDGSYLLFPVAENVTEIALVQAHQSMLVPVAAAVAAVVLALVLLISRKKK